MKIQKFGYELMNQSFKTMNIIHGSDTFVWDFCGLLSCYAVVNWNIEQLEMCIPKFREGQMKYTSKGCRAFFPHSEILSKSQNYHSLFYE